MRFGRIQASFSEDHILQLNEVKSNVDRQGRSSLPNCMVSVVFGENLRGTITATFYCRPMKD